MTGSREFGSNMGIKAQVLTQVRCAWWQLHFSQIHLVTEAAPNCSVMTLGTTCEEPSLPWCYNLGAEKDKLVTLCRFVAQIKLLITQICVVKELLETLSGVAVGHRWMCTLDWFNVHPWCHECSVEQIRQYKIYRFGWDFWKLCENRCIKLHKLCWCVFFAQLQTDLPSGKFWSLSWRSKFEIILDTVPSRVDKWFEFYFSNLGRTQNRHTVVVRTCQVGVKPVDHDKAPIKYMFVYSEKNLQRWRLNILPSEIQKESTSQSRFNWRTKNMNQTNARHARKGVYERMRSQHARVQIHFSKVCFIYARGNRWRACHLKSHNWQSPLFLILCDNDHIFMLTVIDSGLAQRMLPPNWYAVVLSCSDANKEHCRSGSLTQQYMHASKMLQWVWFPSPLLQRQCHCPRTQRLRRHCVLHMHCVDRQRPSARTSELRCMQPGARWAAAGNTRSFDDSFAETLKQELPHEDIYLYMGPRLVIGNPNIKATYVLRQ